MEQTEQYKNELLRQQQEQGRMEADEDDDEQKDELIARRFEGGHRREPFKNILLEFTFQFPNWGYDKQTSQLLS